MNLPAFTLAHWGLLIAALLPIVCAGIAKSGTMKTPPQEGGYDNHDPRAWMARQSDWRARADNAQSNSFEALPFFFAAVLSAQYLRSAEPGPAGPGFRAAAHRLHLLLCG